MSEAARRAHFGDFYAGPGPTADRPVLLVVGNCQAESLRLLVDGPDVRTVRMPAVHELTEEDAGLLHAWARRTTYLVAQPVRDDYRGLPVGTSQLAALLPADGRLVVVPGIRYAGLYPYHVLEYRTGAGDPPVAPYHDLRTVARAAGRTEPPPELTTAMVRTVAADSLAEARTREERTGAVPAADLLTDAGFAAMRTINHPGNAVLGPLAARVRATLGLDPHPPDVDRPLLNDLHAPRHPVVAALYDPDAEPTGDWRIGDRWVADDDVAAAHLAWYAERPHVVAALRERYAGLAAVLGLA